MKADSFSADWYDVVAAPSFKGIVSIIETLKASLQAFYSCRIEMWRNSASYRKEIRGLS